MEIFFGIILFGGILYLIFRKSDEKPSVFKLTEEFSEILQLLNNSNENLFITGKAGTGKSSLLNHFVKNTKKRFVILAPTGIAALNVGGQTIHSFFKFPPSIIVPEQIFPEYKRADLFKKIEMVIIDEVSMVRADLMDGIDIALRKNRNRLNEPFGGVQMVFIGDLFQLPPVLTSADRTNILSKYSGEYFFYAPVFEHFNYNFMELTKIFRQADEQVEFKNMLNNIRNNSAQYDDMVLLNSRYRNDTKEHSNCIFLTTRKNIARNINIVELKKLEGKEFEYEGRLSGKYLKLQDQNEEQIESKLPAPYKLRLKKHAQIIMVKNDPGKRWVNGSIGKISFLDNNVIKVEINGNIYKVEKESWTEYEYLLNKETEEIEKKNIAEFNQYPIRLSYAMTIHKSQGKTFEKIVVDVGNGAFAHGQVYVALSRSKTLEGIFLNNPIRDRDIIVDQRVIDFHKKGNSDCA